MTTHKLRSELNAAVEECDRAQYELNVLHLQMKITRMALIKVKQHVNRAMFADFAARHQRFRKSEAAARAQVQPAQPPRRPRRPNARTIGSEANASHSGRPQGRVVSSCPASGPAA